MNKSDLMKQWYEDVWVKGDLDAIDRLFEPQTQAEGLIPGMQIGPDDFRDLVMAFRQHFGDIQVDMPLTVENGEWLSALLHVNTTRADNGGPIEVTGQVMARFDGDKMVEAYNQFDFISLFEQMGQLPQDTLPICMTGQRLDWA